MDESSNSSTGFDEAGRNFHDSQPRMSLPLCTGENPKNIELLEGQTKPFADRPVASANQMRYLKQQRNGTILHGDKVRE